MSDNDKRVVRILDSNGITWLWDGEWVYLPGDEGDGWHCTDFTSLVALLEQNTQTPSEPAQYSEDNLFILLGANQTFDWAQGDGSRPIRIETAGTTPGGPSKALHVSWRNDDWKSNDDRKISFEFNGYQVTVTYHGPKESVRVL